MIQKTFEKDLRPIFETKGSKQSISDWEIIDNVTFGGNVYQCDWLIFKNVAFLENFQLTGLSLGVGLKFIDCIFYKGIFLKDFQTTGNDSSFDIEGWNIIFEKCDFKSQAIISGMSTTVSKGIVPAGASLGRRTVNSQLVPNKFSRFATGIP